MREKKPRYANVWRCFLQILRQSKLPYGLLATALVSNTVCSFIGLKMPGILARLLGEVRQSELMLLFWLGMGSILIGLITASVKNLARCLIDKNLQLMAVDKIMFLRMEDIEKTDPREMVSRITTDTKLLSEMLLTVAVDELPRLYYMTGALITVYRNHSTRLALVMLLAVPVTLLGSWIAGKLIFGKSDAAQASVSHLTARLGEKVNNMELIKSYNSQAWEAAAGDAVIRELEVSLRRKAVIDRISAAMTSLVTLLPTLAVIVTGAVLVVSGDIEVTSFVAYYALAGTFIGHVVAHMTLWIAVKNAQGATYRLSRIMEQADEISEVTSDDACGTIEFRDVCKSFGGRTVLDHVSFTLEIGKKTALVGYSGSGKSTVLNLIEQFYRPDSGEITMGGKPVSDWDISSYRSHFTYVPQNAPGFSGTVRELICYGLADELSDETLWQILKRVDADGFVTLLGGLDYHVGNNAGKLSGGQKQKLSMARALLNPREILLLDEATSALDVQAASLVQQELDKIAGTMILVAHDLATVRNADKILVFDDGKVIAQGNHGVLMETCPLYRKLAVDSEGGNENEK